MDAYFLAMGSAVWLGILTSISPCPLGANIAAISYIGKRIDRPVFVLLSGLFYTVGRSLVYIAVGVIVVASVLSIPEVALFLQRHMSKFLGPILIIVGIVLLDILPIRIPGTGVNSKWSRRVERWGLGGAFCLGLLFALSFCPVSAALFFGSLIPLAVKHQSPVVMPIMYGVGTALPVVSFAALIALGAGFVGTLFNRLTAFEKWARRITAVVFIGAGLYYLIGY